MSAASRITEGSAHALRVEGREIALCRVGEEVYAMSGTCSYHPMPLRGAKVEGAVLTCPWYGIQFDVRSGESVFLPSVQPAETYAATVREGQVFVHLPVAPAEAARRWAVAEQ